MLYLLFALTFLAGILFYGMSPREDKLSLDINQAEGMIVSFLNQHQAAKDYVYSWMGVGQDSNAASNVKADVAGHSFLKAQMHLNANNEIISDGVFDFTAWMPRDKSGNGMTADVCENGLNSINLGRPGLDNNLGGCFVSKVVCANNNGAVRENCSDPTVRERYVVTYGGWENCDGDNCSRPKWWPLESGRSRKFERWRKAIAKRTRGSLSCGTLYRNGATWCIDNGETVYKQEGVENPVCINPVPLAVINALPYSDAQKDDLLFCYSKVKQGLGDYASGMTHFYDGFSNLDFGLHTNATNSTWTNLQNTAQAPMGNNELQWGGVNENKPHLLLNTVLNTGIVLSDRFTLTLLVDTPTGGETATLLGWNNGTTIVFQKKESGGDVFWVDKQNEAPYVGESACNNFPLGNGNDDPRTKDRIISWTMVVQPCQDNNANTCIDVYENAAQHTDLSGQIQSPAGQTLSLATNGTLKIYGIRYYPNLALTREQIQQNYKVDQKRFGMADFNNGKIVDCIVNNQNCGAQRCGCICQNVNNGGE